ncbi:immunoglobulin heavy constant mu isoform X2 [Danio rerio]|uniref:immunoglobulin heavy constant mu isoform X2 n=1 Tax=Danio rerio TaxID=7955 RepID=UPI003CE5B1D0
MSHCAAFDYWGKGTQVTVADETLTAPVVFKMSQCSSSTDSLIIGCLASEFSPDSVNFRWSSNGNEIKNVTQHSTANNLKFSYITITKKQRYQSDIMCTADHPSKTVNETFSTDPTLSLVLVPTEKNTFAMCVIEDFYTENITVRWKENNIYKQSQTNLEYKLNMNGLHTALSLYKLNEIVIPNTEYTCEVSHRGKTFHKTQNFTAKFRLMLKPPMVREMFINNRIVLQAVVSGDLSTAVKKASVSCKMDNVPINSVSQENESQHVKIYNVPVDTTKWFNGGKVTCTTRDTLNNKDIKQEIYFNKGDGQKPSVKIYKPDDINTEQISHVCEVSSPNLGDVYIMWKVNNVYTEGKSSDPIQQQGSTSVVSILTISKKEYESVKTTINCAVVHANMKNTASPLLGSTSKKEPPEPETGFALHCNEDVLEEDEFRSLWSTATSFIFLFLFSLTYSAVLSLFKMKQ